MTADLSWRVCRFSELTVHSLYAVLRLRDQVFVVEQDSVYGDIDNLDQDAWHVLACAADGALLAYARVLVELHNLGAFEAGLTLVGTLAYMAWLNEFGVIAVSARTQDIDLARRQRLKLAAPLHFLEAMQATGLPFAAVPGLPSHAPSTSVKLPGVQGLRVDLLAPGEPIGRILALPELDWAAQAVPHYDYLLDNPEPGALLAGGHCIPVRLPQPARFVWHKLYASTRRSGFPEKAAKDRQQALILAAALNEHDPSALRDAWQAAPAAIREAICPLREQLLAALSAHPETRDTLADCLAA